MAPGNNNSHFSVKLKDPFISSGSVIFIAVVDVKVFMLIPRIVVSCGHLFIISSMVLRDLYIYLDWTEVYHN